MNTLYYGDNLNILLRYGGNTRGSKCVPVPRPFRYEVQTDTLPTGRVSALCDPPFKSNRNYNVLFKDTWHWKGAASTYDDLILEGDKVWFPN